MEFDFSKAHFHEPVKKIFDTQGTADFQKSVAMYRIQLYFQKYINICQSHTIPTERPECKLTHIVVSIIVRLSKLIDETPPEKTHSRFGNLSYRDWHTKFNSQIKEWLEELIPRNYHICNVELIHYILNSFGSKERIDYGTGHELSFIAFVICLDLIKVDILQGPQLLFCLNSYYKLIHKLILTYRLEPAGSHGVWGLDDHFHFSYIIGASQFIDSMTTLLPKDISNGIMMKEYKNSNLLCESVNFINTVKSGPFSNHSPLLYNISRTVHSWNKLEQGLIKMYKVEVLNKFPVVQHFWFGKGFFPWISCDNKTILPTYQPTEVESDENLSTMKTSTKMPPPLSVNTSRFIHRR